MKTTLIIILAVIAYLVMGLVTWFLMCLAEKLLDDRDDLLREETGFLIGCMFLWVVILPIGGVVIFANVIKRKAGNLIDIAAEAIEKRSDNE